MVPKPLPVPDLQATVERTVHAASALLPPEDLQAFKSSAQEFQDGAGPQLQQRLVDFARERNQAGESYLSRDWLRSYLETRTPLPLTTSVAFQLAGFAQEPGLGRAADFLHRAAVVHLQQLRAETPVEVDPRGHHLDMAQWQILAPGIRHPLPECDQLRRPQVDAADSHIGVLVGGRLFSMPITDDDGAALPPAAISGGLDQVLVKAQNASDQSSASGGSFCDLSYLGSQFAGEFLGELLEDPANAHVYEQLTRMLFMVNLIPVGTVDPTTTSVDRLKALAFEIGHAWAYKPVTYEIALDTDWLGIHFEHSAADGATIRAAAGRMLEVQTTDGAAQLPTTEPPVELTWRHTPDQQRKLDAEADRYRENSAQYTISHIAVDRPTLDRLPMKVSEDAVQQLVLTYAQLATFGKVRAAYESVDMREFQAGRTECLRPVTPEAVIFAQALLDGEATVEQCADVMEAHRNWVKACKTGQGLDRHLLGLELMVAEEQGTPEFLTSPGRHAISQDFLSTTSLGQAQPISRYAFAPAGPETLGVGYVQYPDHYEYVINHHVGLSGSVREFTGHMRAAAEALQAFTTHAN